MNNNTQCSLSGYKPLLIRSNIFSITFSILLACPATTMAETYFTGLGDLPGGHASYPAGIHSSATAVSADGSVIVGNALAATGTRAFRWTATEGMQDLGDLPGYVDKSSATGVSADGSVVVGSSASYTSANGHETFRWTASTGMVGLGDLPGSSISSGATGVSADGSVIVGNGRSAYYDESYRWDSTNGMTGLSSELGVYHNVNAISADGSTIVGAAHNSSYLSQASILNDTDGHVRLGTLTGDSGLSTAYGVSADGSVVVGRSSSLTGVTEAFRWTADGGMMGLGHLTDGSNMYGKANGVSADGSIVVGYSQTGGGWDAFIWDEAHGMRSLEDLLFANGVDLTGWSLEEATAISADGSTIVGWGINSLGANEAWMAQVTIVPVPASVWLLGSGLIGLISLAKRRCKTS